MEAGTSFELNHAVRAWRERLASSPSLRNTDVDELEGHLRDGVEELRCRGLGEEEAFWLACRRLGTGRALEAEFGKVHGERVWLDRLAWAVGGGLLLGMVQAISRLIAGLAVTSISVWQPSGAWLGLLGFVVESLILVAAGVGLWGWMASGRSGPRRLVRWVGEHPWRLAAGAAGLSLAMILMPMASTVFLVRTLPLQQFGVYQQAVSVGGMLIQLTLGPALLGWVLARRLRMSAPAEA